MMNIDQLVLINKSALNFQQSIWLWIIEDGCKYLMKTEDSDVVTWLIINGYLTIGEEVTLKGKEHLKSINIEGVSKKVDIKADFKSLWLKLQLELMALTGKKQKMLGGKYAFLCNCIDLENKLSKVIKKYKLIDFYKIEKLLLKYIYVCYKSDWSYASTIEYYISKNDSSKLASDYENFNEEEETKQEIKQVFDL